VKRLVLLGAMVATLAVVVACGGPTTGQPSPATTADSTGATSSGSGSADPTTAGGTAGSLPVNEPCSLLSSGDLTHIGVSSPPTQDMVGTAHDCSLETSDYSIGVALRTNGGMGDFQQLPGGTVQNITVGNHSAKQEKVDSSSSCVVVVGVTSSSRVDVTATGDGNTDPCPTALAVAKLVEPKLP
jgi:hypothetical protein